MQSITTPYLPVTPNSEGWAPESDQSPKNISAETKEKMLFLPLDYSAGKMQFWSDGRPSSLAQQKKPFTVSLWSSHKEKQRKEKSKDEERLNNIV